MNATQEELKLRLQQAIADAFGDEYQDVDPVLATTSNPKFGDYQANVALSLSKKMGQPAKAIAGAIVDKLEISDICEPPEIAGPGFINLRLRISYLESQLQAIQTDPRLGIPTTKNPQRKL